METRHSRSCKTQNGGTSCPNLSRNHRHPTVSSANPTRPTISTISNLPISTHFKKHKPLNRHPTSPKTSAPPHRRHARRPTRKNDQIPQNHKSPTGAENHTNHPLTSTPTLNRQSAPNLKMSQIINPSKKPPTSSLVIHIQYQPKISTQSQKKHKSSTQAKNDHFSKHFFRRLQPKKTIFTISKNTQSSTKPLKRHKITNTQNSSPRHLFPRPTVGNHPNHATFWYPKFFFFHFKKNQHARMR